VIMLLKLLIEPLPLCRGSSTRVTNSAEMVASRPQYWESQNCMASRSALPSFTPSS
jgi:hypothetical protein